MNKTARDSLDGDPAEALLRGVRAIEELNLFESFTSLLITVTEGKSRAISARENLAHIGPHKRVYGATLHLLDFFFLLHQVQVSCTILVEEVVRHFA